MKKILYILLIFICSSILFSQDLSQSVSINADGATLKDVCDYLSMQTKLNIKAGKSDVDWEVFDRRCIIHVENVPLKDLMVAMANVFNMSWESAEDGTLYLVYSDSQKESELKNREAFFEKEKKDFKTRQTEAYDAIVNKTCNNTYGNLFYNSEYYKCLIDFFNTFPKVKDVLLEKKSMRINYSQLNENKKRTIQTLAFSYIDFNSDIQVKLKEQLDIFQNSESISILVNPVLGAEDKDIEKDGVFGKILVKGEKNNNLEIVILNPLGKYSDLIAKAMIKLASGEEPEEVGKKLQVDVLQFKIEIIEKSNTPCENIYNGFFEEKYNFKNMTGRRSLNYKEFCEKIHNITGLNIVSDYFYRSNFELDDATLPLNTTIQNATNQFEVNGKFSNNIMELQDKLYYVKAAGTVPSVWIDYWVVKAFENSGYSIDDLMNMAKLNDVQIDMEITNNPDLNATIDKELRFNTKEVTNKRYTLRFLASLSEDMLKKLFESKLSAFELDDFQWIILQKALEEADGFYVPEKKSSQVIRLTRERGRVIEYTLEYSSDMSTQPITITILTNKFKIKNPNKN